MRALFTLHCLHLCLFTLVLLCLHQCFKSLATFNFCCHWCYSFLHWCFLHRCCVCIEWFVQCLRNLFLYNWYTLCLCKLYMVLVNIPALFRFGASFTISTLLIIYNCIFFGYISALVSLVFRPCYFILFGCVYLGHRTDSIRSPVMSGDF